MALSVHGRLNWPSWCTVVDDHLHGVRSITVTHHGRSVAFDTPLSSIGLNHDTWDRAHRLKSQLIAEKKTLDNIVTRLKS